MQLLESRDNKIGKKNESIPSLEITEVTLFHCNIVDNDYQQDSRVFYTVVPDKPFDSLLEIQPTNFIFLKTFNSLFQNNQPLDLKDLTSVIK